MNGLTALSGTKQLFNRLLFIQRTIWNHILQKEQHQNTFSTTVCKVIQGISAKQLHHKVIVGLCSEVIFYIVHTNPVNMRHRLLLLCSSASVSRKDVPFLPQNICESKRAFFRSDNTAPAPL